MTREVLRPKQILLVASGPNFLLHKKFGAVAQLGEHLVRNEGVRGSNPLSSTKIFRQGKFWWILQRAKCHDKWHSERRI